MRSKRHIIHRFRVNNEEEAIIQQKFELSELKNLSEFFRDMVMMGLVVEADDGQLARLESLIGKVSQNVNQIARRANASGNVYSEDIAEIRKEVNEIWQQQASILSLLQRVRR